MNVKHGPPLALLAIALVGLLGCGGNGLKTVPVYGAVTFQGRELPKVCRLFFRPVASQGPSRPSITEVTEDGTYEVRAFKDSDGLIPGTYRIGVSFFDLRPGGNPDVESHWVEQTYDAGEVVVDPDADEVEHNIDVPGKLPKPVRR